MKLLWKLLHRHLSIGQIVGFFVANLVGMTIILLSVQFYEDITPTLKGDDGILSTDYIIVTKRIGTLATQPLAFSEAEQAELNSQPFVQRVGAFTSSHYRVKCQVGLQEIHFSSDMFFESVPDDFVDIKHSLWQWNVGEAVPIVLPKSYLALYNFGFAQSHNLPKIGEGLVSMLDIKVELIGNEQRSVMPARLVGFSSRLNTILVPASFLEWSNNVYAPEAQHQRTSRLIMQVKNPTDERIVQYAREKGYDIDDDKLQAGKTMYFLKVVISIVLAVGLLISALSFYILMLSIFLLVQKNQEKIQSLLLIGYDVGHAALPYQCLCIGVNLAVLLAAIGLTYIVRSIYLEYLWRMFNTIQEGSLLPMILTGIVIFFVVSCINTMIIYHKIKPLWKHL